MDTIWIMMVPAAVTGLACLFYPQWTTRRIARRMQEGGDRYFEEQRSYQAYPWQRNPRLIRLSGAVILLLQAVVLGLQLYFP